MIKFIEVKKRLSETKFNIHHINIFHIIEFYEWNGVTQITFSNSNTIEVLDTVEDIIERLNNIKN